MILVDKEKCVGCGVCAQVCPVPAVKIAERKAQICETCVGCGSCVKYCKPGALKLEAAKDLLICKNCGVKCQIPEGRDGACKRFSNQGGKLVLNRPLQIPRDMATVEAQAEDKPRDMEPHRDSEGNVYDFAFGMDFAAVIDDERVRKYR